MAYLVMTNTFVNSTTSDATAVNTNFQDIVDACSDGTIDFNVADIACIDFSSTGTTTVGNTSGDDLVVNARLASSLIPKTTAVYALGSTSLGYTGAYFGANSQVVGVLPSASMSATWNLTLPVSAGSNGDFLRNTGSGVAAWDSSGSEVVSVGTSDWNYTAAASVDTTKSFYCETGNTNRTFTLPAVASSAGREFEIIKTDTGTGTITVTAADGSIEGSSTYVIFAAQYAKLVIRCVNGIWYVLEHPTVESSTSTTFTWNGGSPSGSVTLNYKRSGKWVTLTVPGSVTATTGTGSTVLSSNTAIAAWARPSSTATTCVNQVVNAGSAQVDIGVGELTSAGVINFYRDSTGAAFTNGSSCGWNAQIWSFTYAVV